MQARSGLVFALVATSWILIGGGGALGTTGLGLALGGGFLASCSPAPRTRALGLLVPALASTVRAAFHAAHPAPPRLLLTLAGIGCAGFALALALQPLGTQARGWRSLSGLVLSSAVLCVLVAALERYARWAQPLEPYAFEPAADSLDARAFHADPVLGLVLHPGFHGRFVHPEYRGESVEFNADGFRDRPWPAGDDPASFGILMLGDSTLFGMGVEGGETIPARLEVLLAARRPTSAFRVYNTGVSGHGPRHERLLAARLLGRLRPRLCVVLFYDGNDLADCRRQFVESREAGAHAAQLPSEELLATGQFRAPDFLRAARVAPPLWTRHYWLRYSALFRDFDRRVANALVGVGWMPVGVASNNSALRAMQRTSDPGIQDELALAVEALRGIAEDCRAHGSALVVARLPGALQAEPTSLRLTLERLGQDPTLFDRTRPGSVVLERARADGAITLDLLPVLEVGEDAISPYYFREGHPNRAGNERIARALADFLEQSGLLE